MNDSLSHTEILVRLMDKVDVIKSEQAEHIAYTRAKLESIETQALKTNGRVSSLEDIVLDLKTKHSDDIQRIKIKQENLGVKLTVIVFVV